MKNIVKIIFCGNTARLQKEKIMDFRDKNKMTSQKNHSQQIGEKKDDKTLSNLSSGGQRSEIEKNLQFERSGSKVADNHLPADRKKTELECLSNREKLIGANPSSGSVPTLTDENICEKEIFDKWINEHNKLGLTRYTLESLSSLKSWKKKKLIAKLRKEKRICLSKRRYFIIEFRPKPTTKGDDGK